MKISLIVAVAENGIIGKTDGGIPWDLKWDAKHFRSFTAGKWMLLGRKTYAEMNGWFTTQVPIVLSSQDDFPLFQSEHHRASNLKEAIQLASGKGADELVVSGGARVYEAALPFVEEMLITRVHTSPAEGIEFPPIPSPDQWEIEELEFHPQDSANSHAATLRRWIRKNE